MMVVNTSVCLMKLTQTIFKFPSRHEFTIKFHYLHCSKGYNSKVGKSVVIVLFSACHLMVFNISVKFHENILTGFQVTDWTRVYDQNPYL